MGDRDYYHHDEYGRPPYERAPPEGPRYHPEERYPPRGGYQGARGRGVQFKIRGRANYRGSPSTRGGTFRPERSHSFPGQHYTQEGDAMDLDPRPDTKYSTATQSWSPENSGSSTPTQAGNGSNSSESAIVSLLTDFVQHITAAAAASTERDIALSQLSLRESAFGASRKFHADNPALTAQKEKAIAVAKQELLELEQKSRRHQSLRDQHAADLARSLRANGNLQSNSEEHQLRSMKKEIRDMKCNVGQLKHLPGIIKKEDACLEQVEEMKSTIQSLVEKNSQLESKFEIAIIDNRKMNAQFVAMGLENKQRAKQWEELKSLVNSSQSTKIEAVSNHQQPSQEANDFATKLDELILWKQTVEGPLKQIDNTSQLEKVVESQKESVMAKSLDEKTSMHDSMHDESSDNKVAQALSVVEKEVRNIAEWKNELEERLKILGDLSDLKKILEKKSQKIDSVFDAVYGDEKSNTEGVIDRLRGLTDDNENLWNAVQSLSADLDSTEAKVENNSNDVAATRRELNLFREEQASADDIVSQEFDKMLADVTQRNAAEIDQARQRLTRSIADLEGRVIEVEARPLPVREPTPEKDLKRASEPALPPAALALVDEKGNTRITVNNFATLQGSIGDAVSMIKEYREVVSTLKHSVKDLEIRLQESTSERLIKSIHDQVLDKIPRASITDADFETYKDSLKRLETMVKQLESGQPTRVNEHFFYNNVRHAAQWLISMMKPELEKYGTTARLADQRERVATNGSDGSHEPKIMAGETIILSPTVVPSHGPGFRSNSLPSPGQVTGAGPTNHIQQAPSNFPPRPGTMPPAARNSPVGPVSIAPRPSGASQAVQISAQQQMHSPLSRPSIPFPSQIHQQLQSQPVQVISDLPTAYNQQGPSDTIPNVRKSVEAYHGEFLKWQSTFDKKLQSREARDVELRRALDVALNKYDVHENLINELHYKWSQVFVAIPTLQATCEKNSGDLDGIRQDVAPLFDALRVLGLLQVKVDELKSTQERDGGKIDSLWRVVVDEVRKTDERLLDLEQSWSQPKILGPPDNREENLTHSDDDDNDQTQKPEQSYSTGGDGPTSRDSREAASQTRSGLFVSPAPSVAPPAHQPPRSGSLAPMSMATRDSKTPTQGADGNKSPFHDAASQVGSASETAPANPITLNSTRTSESMSTSFSNAKDRSPDSILGPNDQQSWHNRVKREGDENDNPSHTISSIPPINTSTAPPAVSASKQRQTPTGNRSGRSSPAGLGALPAGALASWQVPPDYASGNGQVPTPPARPVRRGSSLRTSTPDSRPKPWWYGPAGDTTMPDAVEPAAGAERADSRPNASITPVASDTASAMYASPAAGADPSVPSEHALGSEFQSETTPTFLRDRLKRKRRRVQSMDVHEIE